MHKNQDLGLYELLKQRCFQSIQCGISFYEILKAKAFSKKVNLQSRVLFTSENEIFVTSDGKYIFLRKER
jgi:hypothetical protein